MNAYSGTSKDRIYLDNNATTPLLPAAREAMFAAMDRAFANPSSYHYDGLMARYEVEAARERVAAFIGAQPAEIIFTSSGTEANNMAIFGAYSEFCRKRPSARPNIVTSRFEHPSVAGAVSRLAAAGAEVRCLSGGAGMTVDPAEAERLVDGDTALVTVMLASNETGAIFPAADIGRICAARGAVFHVDAVCATGKMRYSARDIGCDLLSVSAHKLYGPKGIACLFRKRGVDLAPIFSGGHQEAELRAGTENVPAIAGFGAACEYLSANFERHVAELAGLREIFISELEKAVPSAVCDLALNTPAAGGVDAENALPKAGSEVAGRGPDGSGARAFPVLPAVLPNTVSVTFDIADPHMMNAFMFNLDLAGLSVSLGAACASMAKEASPSLMAAGLSEAAARSTVRVSFGIFNTAEEARRAAWIMAEALGTARRGAANGGR